MADTKTEPILVKAGKPEAGDIKKEVKDDKKSDTPVDNDNQNGLSDEQLKKLTDEQIKMLLKEKGIDLGEDSLENLKEKISVKPQPVEPTLEEKAADERAMEKRMIDFFIEHGGTPEGFIAIKQVVNMDLKSLSESEIRRELKEANFNDDEIDFIIKERYYQINPDELVQEEYESDEEFEKRKEIARKKAEYGAKKLESKAYHIKKQAEDALRELREAIQTEEMLKAKEAEFKSGIDSFAKKYPRKHELQLGEINNEQISPVEIYVTDEDISEALSVLSDAEQRKQYFFNGDNLNIETVGDLLIKNRILGNALKAAYIEGGKHQVEYFEKVFPGRKPSEIGVGGKDSKSVTGQIIGSGKPEVSNPLQRQKV